VTDRTWDTGQVIGIEPGIITDDADGLAERDADAQRLAVPGSDALSDAQCDWVPERRPFRQRDCYAHGIGQRHPLSHAVAHAERVAHAEPDRHAQRV
jgi:hypothetical protein